MPAASRHARRHVGQSRVGQPNVKHVIQQIEKLFPTMTQQFWTEFLELYKENSCLWDIHSSSYLRRDLRNAAYNVLLAKYRELDPIATLDMVKKKIDIFRTGFRREQRKINEQNIMPGAEYKPTLWYYSLLSFLNYQDYDATQGISVIKESNESDDQNGETTIEYVSK